MLFVKRKGRWRWSVGVHAEMLASLKIYPPGVSGNTLPYSDWNDVSEAWSPFLNAEMTTPDNKPIPVAGSVDFVLSNQFCWFLVVPWSDAFLVPESRSVYLRAMFSEAYGDVAESLDFVCQDITYGLPRIVCGVKHELLSRLKALCEIHQLKFNSCRPFLDTALAYFYQKMQIKNSVFVLVEKNILTILQWDNTNVLEIDSESYEEEWDVALEQWQKRNLLMGFAAASFYIVCPPAWLGGQKTEHENWHYLEWENRGKGFVAENPHYALAACLL